MSWAIARLILGFLTLGGAVAWAFWAFHENIKEQGRQEVKLEQSQKEAQDAKRASAIQNQPDVVWSDYIAKLRSKGSCEVSTVRPNLCTIAWLSEIALPPASVQSYLQAVDRQQDAIEAR